MSYVSKIIRTLVVSIGVFAVCILICSALLYFTSLPQKFVPYFLMGAFVLSSLYCAISAASIHGKLGLVTGFAAGVIVFVVIAMMLYFLFHVSVINGFYYKSAVACSIAGIIGGIVGVNIHSK